MLTCNVLNANYSLMNENSILSLTNIVKRRFYFCRLHPGTYAKSFARLWMIL
jgi:hypothetical protein